MNDCEKTKDELMSTKKKSEATHMSEVRRKAQSTIQKLPQRVHMRSPPEQRDINVFSWDVSNQEDSSSLDEVVESSHSTYC